jgi:hypothetical protein
MQEEDNNIHFTQQELIAVSDTLRIKGQCTIFKRGALIGSEDAKAYAKHIAKCWNNFYEMKSYIEEMVQRYDKSEWISEKGQAILDKLK